MEPAPSHREKKDFSSSDRGRGSEGRYRSGHRGGKWRSGPKMYPGSASGGWREGEERHGPPHSAPPNGHQNGPPRMWRGRGRGGHSPTEPWNKYQPEQGMQNFPYPPYYETPMYNNPQTMYYPPPYGPGGAVFFQPPLPEHIRNQIEYYFSDENLAKDFFLRNQVSTLKLSLIHI